MGSSSLDVSLPSFGPNSRWPPWANIQSKSSCKDRRGLKELSGKPPSYKVCSVEGRSFTAELAVLGGLLLVLTEIKRFSWQPVKKPSVKVLETSIKRNTLKKKKIRQIVWVIISITAVISVWPLSFICHFSYLKAGITKPSSYISAGLNTEFYSFLTLTCIIKYNFTPAVSLSLNTELAEG